MDKLLCDFRVVGPVQTNCYFLYHEDTKECILIDPGDEFEKIDGFIKKNELSLQSVFLTHGHFDHILAADQVRKEYGVPIYASKAEKEVLTNPKKNLSWTMGGTSAALDADHFLTDGQELLVLGRTMRCILTPGHTCGGMSFYLPREGILFSGDTLFQESVGRTDFPTSSMGELIRSVREKLFVLPDAVRVYPGHGMMTSIQHEKMFNPFAVE
ncbi:MAG: MBL fold metallo-hydrolase [Clostridiaceae bacterium]|nr:MBL fold metallo-hydrolase [Clostridiaceae bacterium]